MPLSEWDIQVLVDRGISASSEFAQMDSATFARVLADFDAKGGGEPALLVYRLRAANRGDRAKSAASLVEREAAYGLSIIEWLSVNLPEVCSASQAVVDATRDTYGDVEANRLALSTDPHPAAVAAVIRSHHLHGKRSVRRSVVRAAVKAADDQAVADLCEIAATRRAAA